MPSIFASFRVALAAFLKAWRKHRIKLVPYPSFATLPELAAVAKANGEVKRAEIMEYFANSSPLLAAIPFLDITGSAYAYSVGAVKARDDGFICYPEVERLRIAGGDLDTDRALIRLQGTQIRHQQDRLKSKALAVYLTGQCINGDSDTNPRVFSGLDKRVSKDMIKHINAPLKPSDLGLMIDQVWDANYLVMSPLMYKLFDYKEVDLTDPFYMHMRGGKEIKIPILLVSYNDHGSQIIPWDENENSSIYILNIGEDGLHGIQNGPLEAVDLGEINESPVQRTRVEWLISLVLHKENSLGKLAGVHKSPVVFDSMPFDAIRGIKRLIQI